MALNELHPATMGELEEIAHPVESQYTVEELLEKMAVCSQEYWHAITQMKQIHRRKTVTELSLTAAIQAKNFDVLRKPTAVEICKLADADPKFKPTVDFTKSVVYIEAQELMEPYLYWEAQASAAAKYHQMLTNQLMWHQSENGRLKAEMMTLNGQT